MTELHIIKEGQDYGVTIRQKHGPSNSTQLLWLGHTISSELPGDQSKREAGTLMWLFLSNKTKQSSSSVGKDEQEFTLWRAESENPATMKSTKNDQKKAVWSLISVQ